MYDYLEGFEKRMQFVAVTESIVNRKYTNTEIEGWFEKNQMDNLFFSLLVYIMEQTLSENDECTLENIARFLDDIIPLYKVNLSFADVSRLAEYMVKDILQNKGIVRTYGAMEYGEGWQEITVRLIRDKITEDNRIIYELTDQGYDFLFRTKEVDKELDFKLEQLKLKELLRRKNYKHALRQSRDLIAMLRQKKREMEEFIDRIRQNIHSIDRGEHERLLNETYNLIDEEYRGTQELKQEVVRDEERIQQEIQDVMNIEEPMRGALDNLNKIKRNLQIVIVEQRNLIGKRFYMNNIYEETIKSSFYASMVKRYDFEKEILEQLETVDEKNYPHLWMLMTPLFRPRLNKNLNLMMLYQNQSKLQELDEEEHEVGEEQLEEDYTQANINKSNQLNYRIVELLFSYTAQRKKSFRLSEFYHWLEEGEKHIERYTDDKRLFIIMLKLYEIGEVDLDGWKERDREEIIGEANGEFDLAWILLHIEMDYPKLFGIRKLKIESESETFSVEKAEQAGGKSLTVKTEMTELLFTPQFGEGETDD